jgi:hypothetical protein
MFLKPAGNPLLRRSPERGRAASRLHDPGKKLFGDPRQMPDERRL